MSTAMIVSSVVLSIVFIVIALLMILAAIFSFSGRRTADRKSGLVFVGCAAFHSACVAVTWQMGDKGGWMWIVAVCAIGGTVWLYKSALEE